MVVSFIRSSPNGAFPTPEPFPVIDSLYNQQAKTTKMYFFSRCWKCQPPDISLRFDMFLVFPAPWFQIAKGDLKTDQPNQGTPLGIHRYLRISLFFAAYKPKETKPSLQKKTSHGTKASKVLVCPFMPIPGRPVTLSFRGECARNSAKTALGKPRALTLTVALSYLDMCQD